MIEDSVDSGSIPDGAVLFTEIKNNHQKNKNNYKPYLFI